MAGVRYCYGHADAPGTLDRVRVWAKGEKYIGCARCRRRLASPVRVAQYIERLKAEIRRLRRSRILMPATGPLAKKKYRTAPADYRPSSTKRSA